MVTGFDADLKIIVSNMATGQMRIDDPASQRNPKVYIQRDYSRGTDVRFQSKFPPELEHKIDKAIFEQTIASINDYFADAEKVGGATYVEGCLGCLTAYLIYMCMTTHYNKCIQRLSNYIAEQNKTVYIPRGLMITHPMERGLRVIEITILNSADHR